MCGRAGLAAVAWVALLGLPDISTAQADPHAALPERPSVATHAYTVAPGWVEIEVGFEQDRANDRFGDESVPLTVKLGLARRAQLGVSSAAIYSADGHTLSADDGSLGIKWRFADDVPVVGNIAILPSVTVPTESDGMTAGSVLFIVSRMFGPLSLDVNAGHTWREGDGSQEPTRESMWAAALGGPIRGRFGWMGELSGSPATSGPAGRSATLNSLVGATATLKPSLVVDVAIIAPISGSDPAALVLGFVWNGGALWNRRSSAP